MCVIYGKFINDMSLLRHIHAGQKRKRKISLMIVVYSLILLGVFSSTGVQAHYYRPQRSCEGYVFTPVCDSVNTGGCLPKCMLGYTPPRSRHPPSRQTPLEADTPPGSRHTPLKADTPPRRRPLLRTVRILLECILVLHIISSKLIAIYFCLFFDSLRFRLV